MCVRGYKKRGWCGHLGILLTRGSLIRLAYLSYVKYAMTRIEMLRYHGVTPYVVFDGDRLPAKARTEADRET